MFKEKRKAYLGMGLDYGQAATAVWLFGVGPEEVLVLDLEGIARLIGGQGDVVGTELPIDGRGGLGGFAPRGLRDCRRRRHPEAAYAKRTWIGYRECRQSKRGGVRVWRLGGHRNI